MFAKSTLSSLSTRIMAMDRRPVTVGIDGQGGSGKSTLARELAQNLALSAAIVQGDDFYSDTSAREKSLLTPEEGYEKYFDWRRLESEVIRSTRGGAATLRYQRYDWNIAEMGEWTEIPMPEVVIIEGVYSLRPELRHGFDVTIFVHTNESTRLLRQKERGENSMFWINRWTAASEFYVTSEGPWEWVDFILEGE
jgi:phosphoribulokinase